MDKLRRIFASVLNLDESKILGYFETIHGVFLSKVIFLFSHLDANGTASCIEPTSVPVDAINEVKKLFDYPLFYKAFVNKNAELYLNLQEDIVTSTVITSWIVFEQIVKDLSVANYAQLASQNSVNYENRIFQFEKREIKDLELFYYIRNATLHYNGAYYAAKNISHRYKGTDFISAGHIGEKIETSIILAWDIAIDLEKHSLKAWNNAKTHKKH